MTTSGLGSEISDSDTRADDASSLCSGSTRCFGAGSAAPEEAAETDSLPPDDGVFTEPPPPLARIQMPPPRSSRPRPSSLLGKINLPFKYIFYIIIIKFIGITPARDLTEWKPVCNVDVDSLETPSLFPSLRKARPTSLLNPAHGPSGTPSDATSSPHNAPSGKF